MTIGWRPEIQGLRAVVMACLYTGFRGFFPAVLPVKIIFSHHGLSVWLCPENRVLARSRGRSGCSLPRREGVDLGALPPVVDVHDGRSVPSRRADVRILQVRSRPEGVRHVRPRPSDPAIWLFLRV
jgi:hypothetical protein